jgi:hypothetical protein
MRTAVLVALILAVLVSLSTTPIAAQTTKAKCDPAALFKKAAALKASGDAKKDMAALSKLSADIQAQNAVCNGFNFTGKGEKIVPAFTLPKGLWKVTAKSPGYLIVDARSLEGEGSECEVGKIVNLFNLDREQATEGAETSFDIEVDCRMILEVSNTRTNWTIGFVTLE